MGSRERPSGGCHQQELSLQIDGAVIKIEADRRVAGLHDDLAPLPRDHEPSRLIFVHALPLRAGSGIIPAFPNMDDGYQ